MKTKQTKIPVEIATDYTHEQDNELELARQQIELSGFYLQSLFNSIKYLASDLESRVSEKENEHCYDLRNLADIGYAVSNTIFAAVSHFETSESEAESTQTETVKDEPENTDTGTLDATSFDYGTLEEAGNDTLALALSEILNNDNLPAPVYDAIQDALAEMDTTSDADTERPEYIAKVLRDFKRANKTDE